MFSLFYAPVGGCTMIEVPQQEFDFSILGAQWRILQPSRHARAPCCSALACVASLASAKFPAEVCHLAF